MKKQVPVTVTQTEIIAWAIMHVEEECQRFSAMPNNPWKDKLKLLIQLYKIQTGEDSGFKLDD